MTREEMDFIGSMNMFDEISNEAYRKIMTHCEEQEPCDDCISRQAVLEHREILKDKQGTGYQAVKTKYIRELPSVTPQPKTGRWIMPDDRLYRPICNNCGAHPWKGYIPTVGEATEVFKYCPNCGAKMEVEE